MNTSDGQPLSKPRTYRLVWFAPSTGAAGLAGNGQPDAVPAGRAYHSVADAERERDRICAALGLTPDQFKVEPNRVQLPKED